MNIRSSFLTFLSILQKDENSSIEDYFGDEVLKVRACGMSFITLGINIRECQNQSKWFLKV
ncbi:unnamed protein product [Musa hybrid cultivar]